MPYEIRHKDSKTKPWCVYNTDTGDEKGCTATEKEAIAFMRKLYQVSQEK